ncbi:peroxidase family protein [Salinibacter sp. 10B]|uniref:peroxidase family protein n=1 Tax=Salinibacter sp. 10B TaxID=1923971 RepID=UPI0011B084D2|nr:peroxidase family protein [Salinibacter sp. 10B]
MPSSYEITGSLLEVNSDAPLVGLLVEAYAVDAPQDRRLGGTLTDANGAFSLTVNEPLDPSSPPTIRFTAYIDGRSEVIHQTDPFTVESSPYDLGRLRIVPRTPEPAVPAYSAALGHELPDASAPSHSPLPFPRRFDALPAHQPPDEMLEHLGEPDGPMSERKSLWAENSYDSPNLPAGFTFFAQFLIHDLTYDLVQQASVDRLRKREQHGTSSLRLQSLYGPGPEMAPHLYAFYDHNHFSGRLLDSPAGTKQDLPRNRQGRALIADPRNTENVVLAQLHLALLRFHNHVVDLVASSGDHGRALFDQAKQQVRWHYQWALVHDFLPQIAGPEAVTDALERERRVEAPPTLPLEVAQGVLRYVYSQVRLKYRINEDATVSLVPADDTSDTLLRHHSQSIPSRLAIDWPRFFALGDTPTQPSKLIDTKITPAFLNLPLVEDPRPARRSVAVRFFLQGKRAGLPSGEDVARALGKRRTLPNTSVLRKLGLRATPLLYYVLAEAEHQYQESHDDQLGPVGGQLLADAVIRLLRADPQSYLNAHPNFRPASELTSADGSFGVGELVTGGTT